LCDELGDKFNPAPHLLVEYTGDDPFELTWAWLESATDSDRQFVPDENKQTQYFPSPLPDVRQEMADEAKKRTVGSDPPTRQGD
jgi:hypothetical protein